MDLRDTRTNKRITIDELARQSGIERSRLSRAERGYTKLKPEELKRLAALLGTKGKLTIPSNG